MADTAVRRFEDLLVWQKAMRLAVLVFKLASELGRNREYTLASQMTKSALSIVSNIAEGFDRYGRREFRHFLSIARGSAAELRCQCYLARKLGHTDAARAADLTRRCEEVSRMLAALRASIAPEP